MNSSENKSFYHGYLLDISPFKGLLGGVKQLGYHPKGTSIFPMILLYVKNGKVFFISFRLNLISIIARIFFCWYGIHS